MTADLYSVLTAGAVTCWDTETDVVIVGFGAAGGSAAIAAAEAGADSLVLERGSGISGTTTIATGHFYLGGGTAPQLANGIEDSVEAMIDYLTANSPSPDPLKIRLYCEQSVDHFEWLKSHGIPFNNGFYRRKHFEQPTDECLIWSGNEKLWPIREQAKPAPRGHKVEKTGSEGGTLVMKGLTASAEAAGVNFQFDARVTHLVCDESEKVIGLRYSHFGEVRFVRSRKGVILAAGGFAMNPELLAEHCPMLANDGIVKQGNPNDDGAGILMGVAAGGQMKHMEGALITAPFYPPESLLKGILVNKNGQRFVAEDAYHSRSAIACLKQPDAVAYLIADNATFGRPEIQMQELIDAWETIEDMEKVLGLPDGSLQKTMAEYNSHAAIGKDPSFHKHEDWLQALSEPPYAALQCSLGKSIYVGFTLGGLDVDENGRVLNPAGTSIGGLYAAGACASNIAQDGTGYSSGTCLGEATFFGRRAGRDAATC